MLKMTRKARLKAAFVTVADGLTADSDVVDSSLCW